MGVIDVLFGSLFGNGRNVVRETAEVFRVNAEAHSQRNAAYSKAALQQFAAEFAHPKKGLFDRFVDGLNRIPRPAMALGVLGLMVTAMADPIWFASRMQGIALVPDPLWWLLGAIVSFYFGARSQAKNADFQASIAATMARAPEVTRNIGALNALNALTAGADGDVDADANPVAHQGDNPALAEWKRSNDG